VVTAVYPAREKEIPGITGELVTDSLSSLGKTAHYAKTNEILEEILHSTIKSPMTVLFLSAGDLDAFARKFVEKIIE
jgi:UDP-N-acetylmuramate-alanine ligase